MSRERAKGTAFETAICKFFHARSIEAQRVPGSNYSPLGDLIVPDLDLFSIECKNQARSQLGVWMEQARASTAAWAERGQRKLPMVIHKRAGKGVEESYVTIPLWCLAEWIEQLSREWDDFHGNTGL